ncbi:hypothetical protein MTO96_044345 [Rhipicephalus appendiculatus]
MLEAAYPRVLRSTVVAEATSKDPALAKLRDALWSGAELRDPEFRSYADRKLQTVGVGGAIKNTCGRTSPHAVRLLDCRLSDRLLHRRQGYRLCNKLRPPRSACRNKPVCNRLYN